MINHATKINEFELMLDQNINTKQHEYLQQYDSSMNKRVKELN